MRCNNGCFRVNNTFADSMGSGNSLCNNVHALPCNDPNNLQRIERTMITAIEPKVNANGRYSVTQASEALGIHRNTLRNYTEQGLIKCGFRRESFRKFYEGKEIIRFWKASM